jgi:hypothetical protein
MLCLFLPTSRLVFAPRPKSELNFRNTCFPCGFHARQIID